MKGIWAIPFDENGNMIENQFIQMQAGFHPITQEILYIKTDIVVPLDVWERFAFDNEQIDAIDVEWKEFEPTTAAREEKEYGEIYNWLLSRFELWK